MKDITILKTIPFLSERIWGGKKAKNLGFDTNKDNIGEIWAISAHSNGMSFIEYQGKKISLKEFYENNPKLFNNFKGEYPLLNKILLPEDYLSVQVHPNDEYAKKHHNSLGKPESWYVLDAEKGAQLIYGHKVKTKEEFTKLVEEGKWDDILEKVDVERGDFVNVPPGKIHSICPGVIIYEVQRSSDITYRLYDFDRLDDNGNKRELHIKRSIDNMQIPDSKETVYKNVSGDFFRSKDFDISIINGDIEKNYVYDNAYWLQFTILSKTASINGVNFKKYESGIILSNSGFVLNCNKGDKIIISYIAKN